MPWTALHEPISLFGLKLCGEIMETAVTIGMDIAKSVFVVHGVDAAGEVVVRLRLTRRRVLTFFEKQPPCLVGIEA